MKYLIEMLLVAPEKVSEGGTGSERESPVHVDKVTPDMFVLFR